MDIKKNLKNPDIQYWPDVRWWLAEGFHTDETLKKEIADLHDSGFGAVEFLAMEEPGADSKLYGWGSEEWVHDSDTVIRETTKRNMGVSMTSGTNWSNANLIGITPDDRCAAQELDYVAETVKAGSQWKGELLQPKLFMPGVTKQALIAVVAAAIAGEQDGKKVLDHNRCIVLTDSVQNDMLDWTVPTDADYELFFFYIHGTGQTASPSVDVSYTINYMDIEGVEAFKEYWDDKVLTPELQSVIDENGRGMMYMDSLELSTFAAGGQLWGFCYIDEFKARRGYDITPYLPFIVRESGMMQPVFIYHYTADDAAWFEKLENDLYQTTTDLYMDHMLKPMQEWLHRHNMTLRSEISYGLPFEISQPGKYVDGIETESLEFASQIESYRNLAGPAHIYHRTYSSETGATLLNYMKGLDFYTQIIFTQFAAGVTKTVLHGYSSIAGSEDSTYWPGHEGMWPIFSERFGSRQPAYVHYRDWTKMVARYQMILRQGRTRMDLGILRLDYNFNNMIFGGSNEEELYGKGMMRGNEGMYWKDMSLQNAGYTWDYFAPQILEENFITFENGRLQQDGPGYQALIIYQELMPIASAKKLLALAKAGLPIVFVNGVTETIRPGIDKTHKKAASKTPRLAESDEELAAIISEIKDLDNVRETDEQNQTITLLQELGVSPIVSYRESSKNLLNITVKDEDKLYVFVYNMQYTETEAYANEVTIAASGVPYRIDCWNGEIAKLGLYKASSESITIPVKLAPGEAALYMIATEEAPELHVESTDAAGICGRDGLTLIAAASGTYQAQLSDGTAKTVEAAVPEIIDLPQWNLTVEDWNEGDKKVIIEDRGLGIVTKEVYYETKKTPIDAGTVSLVPWKDIPAVGPEVSGVGTYTASFTLPEGYGSDNGLILTMENANKNTVAVYVNSKKCGAVDFDALRVDISPYVKAGENEIKIEVSTTLNNRLLARGYYEQSPILSMQYMAGASNANMGEEEAGENFDQAQGGEEAPENLAQMMNIRGIVRDYGITGSVKLLPYTRVKL